MSVSPPELVPLVEIVSGAGTATGVAEQLIGWTRALGKRPVHLRRDDSEPARSATALVARGDLGCKTGRGLFGDYDESVVAALIRRRTSVLLALERLAGADHRDGPLREPG